MKSLTLHAAFFVASSLSMLCAMSVSAQTMNASAVYVSDSNAGTDLDGLLLEVNPADGSRSVVTDFNDSSFGPVGEEPVGMVLLDQATLLVLDLSAGQQFSPILTSVDMATGQRSTITDFGNQNQGPGTFYTSSIMVSATGAVLVSDGFGGTDLRGGLLAVDMATGLRSRISDFGDIAQGPLGEMPASVIETSGGDVLVLDQDAGGSSGGVLFQVDMNTGNRTVISDFNEPSQGALGSSPSDMVQADSGDIYVVDPDGGTKDAGQIFRVSATGYRQVVSDFGNGKQGTKGMNPHSIAVDASGELVVSDPGVNLLFLVNTITGERTVVSDFHNSDQGTQGLSPHDIIVVGGLVSLDSDGDSVPNDIDACPQKDATETVVYEGCNSGVDNVVTPNGCTISQKLANSPLSELTAVIDQLKSDGIISRREASAIKECLPTEPSKGKGKGKKR